MAVSKDRVLFKDQGVLVTYERFVEPEGKEYRIEDILAVDMEIVEEESDRPPIKWWRTVGGGESSESRWPQSVVSPAPGSPWGSSWCSWRSP